MEETILDSMVSFYFSVMNEKWMSSIWYVDLLTTACKHWEMVCVHTGQAQYCAYNI